MRPRAYQTVISSPEDSPENLISISSASRVYRPISSSSESSPEKLIASPSPVPLPNWSPGFHEDLNKLFGRRPDDVEDDSPERLSGSTAQDLLNFPEIDEVTAEDLKNLYDDPQTLLEGGDASTDPTGFGDHLDDYDLDDYDLGDDLEDDLEDDPRTDNQKVDHILQDLPNEDSAVQDLEHEHGAGKIAEVCLALKDVKKRAKEAHAILSELGVNPSCLLDINEAVRLLGTASNFLQNISDKHPSKKSLNCSDIPSSSFGSVPTRSRDTKRKKRFSQK